MELLTEFAKEQQLTAAQQEQFNLYLNLLIEWNDKINLTAITEPRDIITYHFKDSLAIDAFANFTEIHTIGDIGTGAGFPGLPLKIKYPELSVVLIEVTAKKVQFLQEVIKRLQLPNVEISQLDWRTFLRKTDYPIDLFVTRAALAPAELIRMFWPASVYNEARLIYWGSADWHAGAKEKKFIEKEIPYQIGNKMRKFVFFKKGADK